MGEGSKPSTWGRFGRRHTSSSCNTESQKASGKQRSFPCSKGPRSHCDWNGFRSTFGRPSQSRAPMQQVYDAGQGHETSFAQLASDRFGLPTDNVQVVHGDTDKVQFGMGTYGSRSGAVGMSAGADSVATADVRGAEADSVATVENNPRCWPPLPQ